MIRLLIVLLVSAALLGCQNSSESDAMKPPLEFDGASGDLTATVVVPTLDSKLLEGQSAVWCSSFQMAWNALGRDVLGGPVEVSGAEDLSARLNASPASASDLPEGSLFHAAGRATPEFLAELRAGMAKQFPQVAAPDVTAPEGSLLAYAYLAASVRFAIPFFAVTGQEFAGTPIRTFGLSEEHEYAYYQLRKQVDVLHSVNMFGNGEPEFIVDPDRDSRPCQIVLAAIPKGETLAAMVDEVLKRIAETAKREYQPSLGPNDTLLIPEFQFRLAHRFKELEGRDKVIDFMGIGEYWIDTALQTIEFRLDKSGADLASEAKLMALPIPSHYHFDRPFLMLMRKRAAERPFFAMWVENAELMVKVRNGE